MTTPRPSGWKPNHKFKGKLILAAKAAKPVTLGDLKVTVVGPMQAQLLALQKQHDEWLRAQKEKKKKSPEAALAAFSDKSVPNLSSIVVLAELGGKSMLLTGDARGDKILEGMELAGLLEKGGNKHVDLLKVPHHGSDNNMETDLLQACAGRPLRFLRRWRAWQPGTRHAANAAGCAGR